MLRKFLRYIGFALLGLFGLAVFAAILVNLNPVQNFLTGKAEKYLSKKLQTKVSIDHLRIDLFNRATLEGVYLEDRQQDTLLYAGAVNIKITDWFFLKKHSTISLIELKRARVNLKRSNISKVWNYEFVLDAFGSGRKDSSAQTLPNIDLKRVKLDDVRFLSQDAWVGADMEIAVGSLLIEGQKIDLQNKKILLDRFEGERVTFGTRDYKGGKPLASAKSITETLRDTTAFNPAHWDIKLDNLSLSNARFYIEQEGSSAKVGLFDERHMDIHNIKILGKNISIEQDTLRGRMNMLSAVDRSGFVLKELSGDVTVSPQISEIKNLRLLTPSSAISGYYAMRYSGFPSFLDYTNKVSMSLKLNSSSVNIGDIAYFAPVLKKWKGKTVKISGGSEGPVDKLILTNMDILEGGNHIFGSATIIGLPDINRTSLALNGLQLATSYDALLPYIPELKTPTGINLKALGKVSFSGNSSGTFNVLSTKGSLNTALGSLSFTLNTDASKPELAYTGSVASTGFIIGTLLPNQELGGSAFSLNFSGAGFDPKTDVISVKGNLPHFDFRNYRYQNVFVDAVNKKNVIEGHLISQDANASVDVNVKVQDVYNQPIYSIKGIINNFNPAALGFYQKPLVIKGKVDANFAGTTFKNVTGSADLSDLIVQRDKDTLNFKFLTLSSTRAGIDNTVKISSNVFDATVAGRFYIDDLPASIQLFLSYYLPSYIAAPASINPNQEFSFSVSGTNVNDILSLADENLKLPQGFNLSGFLDGGNQSLSLSGSIPLFQYKNLAIYNTALEGKGDLLGLDVTARTGKIFSGEKELMSQFDFLSTTKQDKLDFTANTTSSNAFGTAKIKGSAVAENDTLIVSILPSEVFFNNNKWDISEVNKIYFAPKFLHIQNLVVSSDQQRLSINPNRAALDGVQQVQIQNLNLKPLLEMIGFGESTIQGSVSGTASVSNLLDSLNADFNLQSGQLMIGRDSLMVLNANGSYNLATSTLTLKQNSGIKAGSDELMVFGTLGTSGDAQNLQLNAVAKNSRMVWLEPLLQGLAKNLNGNFNGSATLSGTLKKPVINGSVDLINVGFTPDITGVPYKISTGKVFILDDRFQLQPMDLYDPEGNVATISGKISHQNLSQMEFSLNMESNFIKVLALKDYEGENFYGDVYSSAKLRLRGALDDLRMQINAVPAGNSKLYIPLTSSTDLGSYPYISFKKDSTETPTEAYQVRNKLTVNIEAIATTALEVIILIDPATGEQIRAKGNGNVSLLLPPDGDARLNGSYVIEEGSYDFAFKQLQIVNFKKKFNILPGSVINWSGDIAKADVDVKANTLVKARLYDLITNDVDRAAISPTELRDAQLPQQVAVEMEMKGSLTEPELSFKLGLQENRSIGTYAYQKLQRINTNEKELFSQVASLLLLEQFIPPEGINSTAAVSSGITTNMTELLSSFASGQITNLTNKILGVKDLSVDVKYKNYNLSYDNGIDQLNIANRNEAGISVRKNFLNNRLVLDVGGVYDWGRSTGTSSGVTDNLAGDFKLQYLLTEDGRFRLNIFRTSNFDAVLLQNIGRQGVGVSYRKSFNNLSDFFSSRRRILPPAAPITSPVIDSNTKSPAI